MSVGDTLFTWPDPYEAQPPSTSFARLNVRNLHRVLDFAVGEYVFFTGVLPRYYSGLGINVVLHWTAESATGTGGSNVRWQVSFEREGTDIDANSFATTKTQTTAFSTLEPGIEVTSEIEFSDGAEIDNLAVGQRFRIKVERVAADSGDYDFDAQLTAVEIYEGDGSLNPGTA